MLTVTYSTHSFRGPAPLWEPCSSDNSGIYIEAPNKVVDLAFLDSFTRLRSPRHFLAAEISERNTSASPGSFPKDSVPDL
ncbi:hypothetical protein NPIL_222861 [Nephila pilipes]|uniref:Uncharacterized protein n=1 Tax=Nephila pilipes TaxID=299642 RepID=A0A8X6Q0K4_NEPPI|nr:hypothetical protein NPIL_222861 [Nephila pilipes]